VRKLFVGMDVHKRETQACVMDAQGRVLMNTRIPSDRAQVQAFLSKYPGAKVAIEASNTWEWAYDAALAAGTRPVLSHPLKTHLIAKAKVKTDKIDARTLADLLRGDWLVEAYAPTKDLRELRKELQGRLALVRSRTRFKNQIHAHLIQNNLKPPVEDLFTEDGIARLLTLETTRIPRYLRLIDALDDEIDDVDDELAEEAESLPEVQLLKTIPGVGNYTALVLHAWIGDVNRFPTGESLAHYAGLTPSIDASGDTVKTGHVTREGPSILRYVMVQAAWQHVRRCPDSNVTKAFHRIAKKKGSKVAIVACARRMLLVVHAMLRKKEPFRLQGS
jgi:transposase